MAESQRVDPSFLRSRREAFLILGMWFCAFVYTCTYCYLYGYWKHEPLPGAVGPDIGKLVGPLSEFNRNPEELSMPLGLGIPDWVLWGIVAPWGVCIVLSILFCLFLFSEDDLGVDGDEGEGTEG